MKKIASLAFVASALALSTACAVAQTAPTVQHFAPPAPRPALVSDNVPPPPAPVCQYDEKHYSEGSIIIAGRVPLMCVVRDWGVHMSGEPVVLVWEPISSDRMSELRSIMHLPAVVASSSTEK